MATKKSGGTTKNGRDSAGRRLGIKKFGGELVISGNIIARQRGTKYYPGLNVGLGRDHTIFSLIVGIVRFSKTSRNRTVINVVPLEIQENSVIANNDALEVSKTNE